MKARLPRVLWAMVFTVAGLAGGLALRAASPSAPGVAPAPAEHSRASLALRAPPGASAAPRLMVPQPVAIPAVTAEQEARLQALEQRMAELTSRLPAQRQPPPTPDPEQLRQSLLRQQHARMEGHSQQPIDFAWSQQATRSFASDFSELVQGQTFTLRSIDCRSTSCVAMIEWPGYDEAVGSYQVLLHHTYGMDCARSLLLPEPEDPTRRYEAPFILDCQNIR